MKRWFLTVCSFLILTLILAGCKKTERNITHVNYEVSGHQQIPPYSGVTALQTSNYVNKLNIDLLGVEPDQQTLDSDVAFLQSNDLDSASRVVIVNRLMQSEAFFERLFQLATIQLLNGMDRTQIQGVRTEQEFARDFLYTNGDSLAGQIVQNEVQKLTDLLNARQDYQDGNIGISEFYKRFIYNLIYDEINMGSENFAISCFENLLKRYPTTTELANSVVMVDGQPSQVLLAGGNSKLDFANIIVQSSDFHSGLVIDAYQQLLLRKPSSEELSGATVRFVNERDYRQELLMLVITDEYAGF